MATKWVLLKHEETGAVHQFPARTVDAWTARGWQPYEPPPELPKQSKTAKITPKTSAAPAAPGKE